MHIECHISQITNCVVKTFHMVSLIPRLSPSFLFYMRDFIYVKLLCRENGGGGWGEREPGRLWSHADTDDTYNLVSMHGSDPPGWVHVHVWESKRRSPKLVGFLECFIDGSIDGQDYQSMFWRLTLLNIRYSASELTAMIQSWSFSETQECKESKMLAGSLVHWFSLLYSTPKSLAY